MRSLRTLAVFLGFAVFAGFAAQVPRQSPELVINYPGGKQALLSTYKGKVVLLEFIFTTCPHCQVTSQMVSKLQTEFGAKGFQALAVAVNPMALMLVNDFVRDFHINFPVGASERDPALRYLQINESDRWVVPQIVLIDRKGMIHAQTPPQGDEKMQDEANLRVQIEKLLQTGGASAGKKSPAAKKPTT
jgi:peroxiredoxin